MGGNGFDIRISNWYGRSGGHVKQLVYAISQAKASKSLLTWPSHYWFNTKQLSFKENDIPGQIINRCFFYGKDLWIPITASDIYKIGREHVYPLLTVKMVDIPSDYIVIHLRSGDIFRASPHRAYTQPPVSFYRRIIGDYGYKKVILVTDKCKNNPCVAWLKKQYKADVVSGDTSDDFGFLVSAPNLILARSNFSVAASWVSRNLKNLYYHVVEGSGAYSKSNIDEITEVGINLKQYRTLHYIGNKGWTASPGQRKLMLRHHVGYVKRVVPQ